MKVPTPNGRQFAAAVVAAATGLGGWLAIDAHAQQGPSFPFPIAIRDLRPSDVPAPAELNNFIKDKNAAILLGKALFWDVNVGSDGKTACATCHHVAGVDSRTANTMAPALDAKYPTGSTAAALRTEFNKAWTDTSLIGPGDLASTTLKGDVQPAAPNVQLKKRHFPLHQLSNPADRNSAILYETDDVVGSAGVHARQFQEVGSGTRDSCTVPTGKTPFEISGVKTRQVTARQAPSVINAVLSHRSFWDGRASNIFNGVSPFGKADPDAFVYERTGTGGVQPVRVEIPDSSAASQAVGPVESDVEMHCAGRQFPLVGQRLLPQRALGKQAVHAEDSVLGRHAAPNFVGLNKTYAQMIRDAFHDKWWGSNQTVPVKLSTTSTQNFTQMEANFSLFFGLAVQAYEATLISDETPFDKAMKASTDGITPAFPANSPEARGFALYAGPAGCQGCHSGPAMSTAFERLGKPGNRGVLDRLIAGESGLPTARLAMHDSGFFNLGVRPTVEDIGLGGTDPWGNPLALSRQYQIGVLGQRPAGAPAGNGRFHITSQAEANPNLFIAKVIAPFIPVPGFADAAGREVQPLEREMNAGAFKIAQLRNVELTGPYFHDGSVATLKDVIRFYNRGGNRRDFPGPQAAGEVADTSRTTADVDPWGHSVTNHGIIAPLNLTESQMDDLVAFLKTLTDERVRWAKAPFDHPALPLPVGHTISGSTQLAADVMTTLPAVGRSGRSTRLGPWLPFDVRLPD